MGSWPTPCAAPKHGAPAIVSKLAALTALLAVAVAGYAAYSERQFGELSESLDAQIATYKRQRWERPVLRGQTIEGNAATAAREALADFKGLGERERDALATQLFYGLPLSPAQVELVGQHAVLVGKLRAATQRGEAMTALPLGSSAAAQLPSYPLVIDAVLLALGTAAAGGPDDCLLIAADVLRLGQDLVPGATLEASSVAMRIASNTAPVIAHCAEHAGSDAILRAARELHELATHPPPTFGGIELADLAAEVQLRAMTALPSPEGDSPLKRLRRRPALFEAWQRLNKPTRWRELSPEQYPASLETWQREHDWRSRSELPLVANVTAQVDGWLYDDMRGQALLRELTVGMATLAERVRRQRLPREPVGLGDEALRDPYNGQPLKWRVPQDGTELTLWSVGEDRRDDRGSNEWTSQAPLDVVVHFRLRTPAPPDEPLKQAARRAIAAH
jgi:hypothetical protein